ncbi:MAG TPA: hypothetical protein V6C58_25535 [Allocoleopsis sp.]
MAIKNTLLGGTDWTGTDYLTATDLNDTMNAMANEVMTLKTFWMHSMLRSTYDDFESYTTNNTISASSLWTSSTSGDITSNTFTCRASTNAGGTSKEGEITASRSNVGGSTSGTYTIKAIGLTANKHKFFKIYSTCSGNVSGGVATSRISFDGGSTTHDLLSISGNVGISALNTVMVIATGSNAYDCYIAGKKVQTLTDATFEIWLQVYVSNSSGLGAQPSVTMYIDDFYESAGTV